MRKGVFLGVLWFKDLLVANATRVLLIMSFIMDLSHKNSDLDTSEEVLLLSIESLSSDTGSSSAEDGVVRAEVGRFHELGGSAVAPLSELEARNTSLSWVVGDSLGTSDGVSI